jgi:L-lactate dehydrogenase
MDMARIPVEQAHDYASRLLQAAGLGVEQAAAVSRRLIESDLLGHRTHGLAMLPVYLERLADGRIATEGDVTVVSDAGMSFLWDAHRLPGAWITERAIAEALHRIALYPVVTVSIANCSHIGCLQAYLEDIGRQHLIALMMVSDPGVASVAPFGGIDPVITTNPIAACIPTHEAPIMIDQCTSLVSNGAVAGYAATGNRLPSKWLVDNEGHPSDDPAALTSAPAGTIMSLGGEEFGYKGFGLGLVVEAFALALSGFGRKEAKVRGAQGVFIQIINPEHFSGKQAFLDETSSLVARCKASRAIPGQSGIRLPGERALNQKQTQREHGLAMDERVLEKLAQWAARLNVGFGPIS